MIAELGRGEALDFRADLALGRFWWRDANARPVIVAETRLLLSYAHSNKSVLCGWANGSIPASATVPAVPGVPDHVPDTTESHAWVLAMEIAEGVGAHFVYRAPLAQSTPFLGLWNVRPAAEGDAPFATCAPWPYVRSVLGGLAERLDGNGQGVDVLFRGYGRTFIEDHSRRGTPFEAPLRSVGEKLLQGAGLSPDQQRAMLRDLDAQVARYERS
jgi:hypothetical protein